MRRSSGERVKQRWGRSGKVIASVIAAAVLGGCGSDESSLEQHLKQAATQIRITTNDYRPLHAKLQRTLAAVEADDPSGAAERKAKAFTLAGLRSWLRGLESQIAFVENDSGNLPIAARDAHRAFHERLAGANLLRKAGERLDIQIGVLGGF
jgi:hypothetical protein